VLGADDGLVVGLFTGNTTVRPAEGGSPVTVGAVVLSTADGLAVVRPAEGGSLVSAVAGATIVAVVLGADDGLVVGVLLGNTVRPARGGALVSAVAGATEGGVLSSAVVGATDGAVVGVFGVVGAALGGPTRSPPAKQHSKNTPSSSVGQQFSKTPSNIG